jgi:hypothetical protein
MKNDDLDAANANIRLQADRTTGAIHDLSHRLKHLAIAVNQLAELHDLHDEAEEVPAASHYCGHKETDTAGNMCCGYGGCEPMVSCQRRRDMGTCPKPISDGPESEQPASEQVEPCEHRSLAPNDRGEYICSHEAVVGRRRFKRPGVDCDRLKALRQCPTGQAAEKHERVAR